MSDGSDSGTVQRSEVDVLVIGAGFAGLYLIHRVRGLGLEVAGVEAGEDVGGTWYWNRYPGARCDVESLEYSYSFDEDLQQEWAWTERYATQPEILRYLGHVADRFDLRRSFTFGTRVTSARWDDDAERWLVDTDGDASWSARFLVTATGCLSVPIDPAIPGLDDFAGTVLRTSTWPAEEPDLTGLRVGIVGTGSSGVQAIPLLAERSGSLVVFQRTAAYAVPAHNRPLDPEEVADIKADYPALRAAAKQMSIATGSRVPRIDASVLEVDEATREERFRTAWAWGGLPFLSTFNDLLLDPAANELAATFVRDRIRDQVRDPDVVARLTPTHTIGCKRLCIDTDYYATYDRTDVRLVDLGETPIEAVTANGVRLGGPEPEDIDLDVLVLATGFDAVTGALDRIDLVGRDGRRLADAWADGPVTYLGLAVAGFPNLFTITGPGSPSVLTNMVVSIEHHVDWIADLLAELEREGQTIVEAEEGAQVRWTRHVAGVAGLTLFPSCGSWYTGANVEGKPQRFLALPGFPEYVAMVDDITAAGYRGFTRS